MKQKMFVNEKKSLLLLASSLIGSALIWLPAAPAPSSGWGAAPPGPEPPVAASFEVGSGGATLSLSPDGSLVAAGYDGRVEVRSSKTGRLVAEIQARFQPRFTTSGAFLVVEKGRLLDFYSVGSWERPALSLRLEDVDSATFPTAAVASPDDRSVWVGLRRLKKAQRESWLVRCSIPNDRPSVSCPASSTQGIPTPETVSALALSPDASLLAVSQGFHVDLRESKSGKLIFGLKPDWNADTSPITGISFSPDGAYLACSRYSGAPLVWDLRSKELIRLPLAGETNSHFSSPGLKAAFSRDGKRLFGVDGSTFTIWSVSDWKALRVLAHDETAYHRLSLSQNGETAALLASTAEKDSDGRPQLLLQSSVLIFRVDDLLRFAGTD